MGLHLRTSMKTRKKSKKDNNPIATLTCLKCQEKIHYLHSCPNEQSDTQMLLDRHEVENSSDGSTRIFTQINIDKQTTKKLVMLKRHLI